MTVFRLTMPCFPKRPRVPALPARAAAPADSRRSWPAPAWLLLLPHAGRAVARRRETNP
jgi:hypothetical protein